MFEREREKSWLRIRLRLGGWVVALDLPNKTCVSLIISTGEVSYLCLPQRVRERGMNYVSESNATTTTTTTATVNQQPTSAPEEWSVGEQQNTFPLGSKF